MERSEPSLVPEWLRNTGGGTGGGSSIHHLASSQADGPLLAQPKRNRTSKSISNSDGSHSSFLDRSSSTNSRRSSNSNGSCKHEKNSYSRSYSGSSRNQRNKDRESLGIADSWDSEYSDSLTSIIAGRIQKDTLKRSQSMISRRNSEFSQHGVSIDLKSSRFNTSSIGNGTVPGSSGTAGTQKVSFERDFPVLGSDERPTTPDLTRIPSPGLSKGVQGLSIGIPPLIGGEGWTSALAEVPMGSGSSNSSSLPAPQPPPYAAAAATPPACVSAGNAAGASNGLNMADGLVQAPARSQSAPQQSLQTKRPDELPFLGSKRLIPMTASGPKTSVLNPSDKLKPKAAMRSSEVVSGIKNGLQQTSSLQLGSQPVRGGGARADSSKSSAPGKLVVLKSGRENGLSANQPSIAPSLIANGHSTAASVAASVPLKNPNNVKQVEKRLSQAQLQSRNDFFNLVRKKSMASTCTAADSPLVVSSGEHNSDELKDMASGSVSPVDNISAVDYSGAEGYTNGAESDFSEDYVFYPNEEEEAFLRSCGWEKEKQGAAGEGALTEEEINSFVQKVKVMTESDQMKLKPALKLCRRLQLMIMKQSDSEASCSAGATSSEQRAADSSL